MDKQTLALGIVVAALFALVILQAIELGIQTSELKELREEVRDYRRASSDAAQRLADAVDGVAKASGLAWRMPQPGHYAKKGGPERAEA